MTVTQDLATGTRNNWGIAIKPVGDSERGTPVATPAQFLAVGKPKVERGLLGDVVVININALCPQGIDHGIDAVTRDGADKSIV